MNIDNMIEQANANAQEMVNNNQPVTLEHDAGNNQQFVPQNNGQQQQQQQQQFLPQNNGQQQQQFAPQNSGQQQQQQQQQQQFAPQNNGQQQQQFAQQQQPVQQQQQFAQQQQPMAQQQQPMIQQQQPMIQQQQPMAQQQQPMAQQQNQQIQLPANMQMYSQPMEMTMESLDAMGFQVDHWLKPDFHGMQVGEIQSLVGEAICTINMQQGFGFVLGMGLRYGKPASYDFTTDCVTSTKTGQPWVMSLQQANAVEPGTLPYRAAQLSFIVHEDVVSNDGTVVARKGESIGYTTPYSNWAEWSAFHRKVNAAGLLGQEVIVKITNKGLDKNANKWGIAVLELIGPANGQAAA